MSFQHKITIASLIGTAPVLASARTVWCPTCDAGPGQFCVTSTGRRVEHGGFHPKRVSVFRHEAISDELPVGPGLDSRDMAWHDQGLCQYTDPDLFWPEQGGHQSTLAKQICARCPVAAQCLEQAMRDMELDGIWGGTSPDDRVELRKTAALANAA